MSLKDKRVLVVGGGSGIGFAVAQGAIADGATVVVASSNAEKLSGAVKALGASASSETLDATDEAAVGRYFEGAGGFDHIVYTAGDWGAWRTPLKSFAETDLALAADGFRVRFWGAVNVAKHGATRLPSGGSFTVTDGMIAHRPMKGRATATAMAGAIESLTRGLAVDLAPVRVNCVCPGLIQTGLWESIPADRREAQLAQMTAHQTAHQLVPRPGRPAEAAEAYLYFMRNGYVTGQILHVEGGSALGR